MTLPVLPREWAADTNFNVGPIGSPTKVDPGAAISAQGFVPGVTPFAAQYYNSLFNQYSRAVRRDLAVKALHTKPLITGMSTDVSMAAVPLGSAFGSGLLVLKSGANNVKRVLDLGVAESVGAVTSITVVRGAVRSPAGRIVAMGLGGNFNCFSTNGGAAWTAGGTMGLAPIDIVHNATHGRFLAVRSTNVAQFSTDATAWTSPTTSLDSCNSGMAVLANGDTVVAGLDAGAGAGPRFSISTNGGTSWSDTGGTVDDPSGYTSEGGWVCGNGGSTIWHVGRYASNATLRVSLSLNGSLWIKTVDLTPGGGLTFAAQPKIMCCPTSGLLVIIAPFVSGLTIQSLAYASLDGGNTWSDPITAFSTNLECFALAGGRLFVTASTGDILASDGIGWA